MSIADRVMVRCKQCGKNKEVPLVDDVFLSNHAYIFFGNELIQNLNRTIITIDGHIRSRLTSDRNIGYSKEHRTPDLSGIKRALLQILSEGKELRFLFS